MSSSRVWFPVSRAAAAALLFPALLGPLAACDSGPGGPDPERVAQLRVSGSVAALLEADSVRLQAAALDASGAEVPGQTVAWSTRDAAVATVSSEGWVRAVAPGRTTIVARAGGAADSVALEVVLPSFSAVELPKPAGAILVQGQGLNNRGEVAGWAGYSGGASRAVVWRDGAARELGLPGERTKAAAINDRGVVAGIRILQWDGYTCTTQAWIWKDGVETELLPAPGCKTVRAINEQDQVAGALTSGYFKGATDRAYLWSAGQVGYLDPQGTHPAWGTEAPTQSSPAALDRAGRVAVNMLFSNGTIMGRMNSVAYLWEGGRYTPIPQPASGCDLWTAVDLNDRGHALLNCFRTGRSASYLWDGARLVDLAPLTDGVALNERDEVIGQGEDRNLFWRNGKTTPIAGPEGSQIGGNRLVALNDRGQVLVNYGSERSFLLTLEPRR